MNRKREALIARGMNSRLIGAVLITARVLECETKSPHPPAASEQEQVLTDAAQHVTYAEANLPNFACTQTTHRFEDVNNSGWRPIDLVIDNLTYFDHCGVSSAWGLGSITRAIFQPRTGAEFAWQDWFNLRGRKMHVYAYRVPAFKSSYHIELEGQSMDLVTGYHGLVFIDGDEHFVQRITLHADEIPLSFPIQDISIALDYDYARIGDVAYLLPLQFELRSREGVRLIKSAVDYDNYRQIIAVPMTALDSPPASQQ
jgi:hypothetical protein